MSPRRSLTALPLLLLLAAVLVPRPAAAVLGVTDRVLGGSLLVPFFEAGINPGANPEDTLLAIHSNSGLARTLHVQVWSLSGAATGLRFSTPIAAKATRSISMRDFISGASAGLRAQVTQGAFYRGFVTIDLVTGPVAAGVTPLTAGYPLLHANLLEGYVYYTNQQGGSVGGLSMVPLEVTPAAASSVLQGFYRNDDRREEIDRQARHCATHLVLPGGSLGGCTSPTNAPANMRTRYFKLPGLASTTRVIIFAWNPQRAGQGGPSAICTANPGLGCSSSYTWRQYAENGAIEASGSSLSLPFAATVYSLPGSSAGTFELLGVPNVEARTQLYIFSINTGVPPGGQPISAFFEGYID